MDIETRGDKGTRERREGNWGTEVERETRTETQGETEGRTRILRLTGKSLLSHPGLGRSLPNLILLAPVQQNLIPMRGDIPLVALRPVIRSRVCEYRPGVVERCANDGAWHGVER